MEVWIFPYGPIQDDLRWAFFVLVIHAFDKRVRLHLDTTQVSSKISALKLRCLFKITMREFCIRLNFTFND